MNHKDDDPSKPKGGQQDRQKRFYKDTLIVVIGMWFIRLIRMPLPIILGRILGPYGFGVWNSLELFKGYLNLVGIGYLAAIEREVPYYIAKGQKNKANALIMFAYLCNLLQVFVVGLLFSVAVYFLVDDPNSPYLIGGMLVGLNIVSEHFVTSRQMTFRCLMRFTDFSKFKVYFSLIDLTLLAYAYFFGLHGVIIGNAINMLIKAICVSVYFHLNYNVKKYVYFNLLLAKKHFRFALSMGLFKLSIFSVRRIDSSLILFFLGPTQMGVFAMGMVASSFVIEIALALSNVIFPYLMRIKGEDGDSEHVEMVGFHQVFIAVGIVMPILCGPVLFGTKWLIGLLLVDYYGVVEVLPFMFASAMCVGGVQVIHKMFLVDKTIFKPAMLSVVQIALFVCILYSLRWFDVSLSILVTAAVGSAIQSVYFTCNALVCAKNKALALKITFMSLVQVLYTVFVLDRLNQIEISQSYSGAFDAIAVSFYYYLLVLPFSALVCYLLVKVLNVQVFSLESQRDIKRVS
ncbi:MAG: hypothetical protein COA42_00390 [Alteromonadaceae bacterium]|nr:MAG: hypothetical protein COA42_00390 [Alteromonadaceae bacterium]